MSDPVRFSDRLDSLYAPDGSTWYETALREAEWRGRLQRALQRISAIENREYGSDWEEIEEARAIANKVLSGNT